MIATGPFWKRLSTRPAAKAALVFIALVAILGWAANWLGPTIVDSQPLVAPSIVGVHHLGTDALGRDMLARVLQAARGALALGLFGFVGTVVCGVSIGALASLGGLVDAMVTRTIDALASIPVLILVVAVESIASSASDAVLLVTFVLTRWIDVAAIVRAEGVRARGSDYVVAARALGASRLRQFARHVLPNALRPIAATSVYSASNLLLLQSAVDFLGVRPRHAPASWGAMLGEARLHPEAWWLGLGPGTLLLGTLAALYLLASTALGAIEADVTEGRR